mmetsp:Transcript_58181/g.138530  ORF Transcript_58181/g.138530 Transcript_58181/m.138530 type:complete len:112 (+) Transcript_58181:1137-1472(+)
MRVTSSTDLEGLPSNERLRLCRCDPLGKDVNECLFSREAVRSLELRLGGSESALALETLRLKSRSHRISWLSMFADSASQGCFRLAAAPQRRQGRGAQAPSLIYALIMANA